MTPYAFDSQALLDLNFNGGPVLDAIMYVISMRTVWFWLYGVVLWWVIWKWGWKTGLVYLLTALLMVFFVDQTANFFKTYVPKLRPCNNPDINSMVHTVYGYVGGLNGTVSGHAANSIAFAIMSSMMIRKRWYNWAIGVWVVAICYSRIYLGVHYPMDIFFGLITGTIWAIIWWNIYKWARVKYSLQQEPRR